MNKRIMSQKNPIPTDLLYDLIKRAQEDAKESRNDFKNAMMELNRDLKQIFDDFRKETKQSFTEMEGRNTMQNTLLKQTVADHQVDDTKRFDVLTEHVTMNRITLAKWGGVFLLIGLLASAAVQTVVRKFFDDEPQPASTVTTTKETTVEIIKPQAKPGTEKKSPPGDQQQ